MGKQEGLYSFEVGELVRHRLFGYHGVVIDRDAEFGLSDHWYESLATRESPKNEPWYQVLVDGAMHQTYVCEKLLDASKRTDPIRHPLLSIHFNAFKDGRYLVDGPIH